MRIGNPVPPAPAGGVRFVDERSFEQEVLKSDVPVLVEFSAEWCGPCKTVAPDVEALRRELEGKARVVKVDIDRSPLIARELGVTSVPTFVVFHRGRPAGGAVGALKKPQLRQLLDPVLPRPAGALGPEEVAELVRRGRVTPVDTREPAVFARTRIGGAVNLPLEQLESRLDELGRLSRPPVLYCRAGDRTKELAARLAQSGFPVSYLEGGVLAWEAAGFTLERVD
jgi:thioredoxin 1/putative thioredoxin